MNILVSDNKKIIEVVLSTYDIEYKYDDYCVVTDELIAYYINSNSFSFKASQSNFNSIISFDAANKNIYVNAKPIDPKRIEFLRSIIDKDSILINACNMNKEGQLNFFAIKKTLNLKKAYRLWAKELSDSEIKKALNPLLLDSEFDNLALSYLYEIIVDDVVKYYSDKELGFSLNAMQTFVINLLEKNDEELLLFQKRYYYLVKSKLDNGFTASLSRCGGSDQFNTLNEVSDLYEKLKTVEFLVSKYEDKYSISAHPVLLNEFDICTYGKNQFNFSNKETLDILDNLFHSGFITNPRTRSRFLPKGTNFSELAKKTAAISNKGYYRSIFRYLMNKNIDLSVFSSVISDEILPNYGIEPTINVPNPSLLNQVERKFYTYIISSFLSVICGPIMRRKIKVDAVYNNEFKFSIDEELIVSYGYTALTKIGKKHGDDIITVETILEWEEENANSLNKKDKVVNVVGTFVTKESHNRDPLKMNLKTVLKLMEQAGRKRMTSIQREMFKNNSIGLLTKREKAIEDLSLMGLITLDKETGDISIVDSIANKLKTSALPGNVVISDIFDASQSIMTGKITFEQGYNYILSEIRKSIKDIKFKEKNNGYVNYGKVISNCHCPFCNSQMHNNRFTLDCGYCDFKLPKLKSERTFTTIELIQLLNNRETSKLDGFVFKTGSTGSAIVLLNDNKKLVFDFGNSTKDNN